MAGPPFISRVDMDTDNKNYAQNVKPTAISHITWLRVYPYCKISRSLRGHPSFITPLLSAVEYGHINAIKVLLERGFDVKVRDSTDTTGNANGNALLTLNLYIEMISRPLERVVYANFKETKDHWVLSIDLPCLAGCRAPGH